MFKTIRGILRGYREIRRALSHPQPTTITIHVDAYGNGEEIATAIRRAVDRQRFYPNGDPTAVRP